MTTAGPVERAHRGAVALERAADRATGGVVALVVVLAVAALAFWLGNGASAATALGVAGAVLLVACPRSVGRAAAAALVAGTARATRLGAAVDGPRTRGGAGSGRHRRAVPDRHRDDRGPRAGRGVRHRRGRRRRGAAHRRGGRGRGPGSRRDRRAPRRRRGGGRRRAGAVRRAARRRGVRRLSRARGARDRLGAARRARRRAASDRPRGAGRPRLPAHRARDRPARRGWPTPSRRSRPPGRRRSRCRGTASRGPSSRWWTRSARAPPRPCAACAGWVFSRCC